MEMFERGREMIKRIITIVCLFMKRDMGKRIGEVVNRMAKKSAKRKRSEKGEDDQWAG